jgi:hypothetical protein
MSPCIVLDETKGRMFFDTADETSCAIEMGAFYEKYMSAEETGDWSAFSITEDYSAGIYALIKKLQNHQKFPFLKIQTTGPISIGFSIVDENKRAIFYNDEFRDIIVKGMIAKSKWQLQKFSGFAQQMICFIDEPILSAFGSSAYVSVVRDDVVAILNECVEALHASNALCGVHCCGNTEWPILIDAGVDIINFDAFGFGDTISLYPQQIKMHLERGGYLAWGLIPTSPIVMEQSTESIISLYNSHVEKLAAKGIDKKIIHKQTIITPSCGTGSLPLEVAEQVFGLLRHVSNELMIRYQGE